MQSPVWNSTAIFITYDEGGGYYDQVPPPIVDGNQLGFRVPLIVISPYAKENYVSSTVLNHASLLAFIEYNWKLSVLNSFVGSSNIPLDFFNFNSTYLGGQILRAPMVLSSSAGFPQEFQILPSQLPYSRSGSSSILLEYSGSVTSASETFSTVTSQSITASSEASSQSAAELSTYSVSTMILPLIAVLVTIASLRMHGKSRASRP
jgi:hypothetical protein